MKITGWKITTLENISCFYVKFNKKKRFLAHSITIDFIKIQFFISLFSKYRNWQAISADSGSTNLLNLEN